VKNQYEFWKEWGAISSLEKGAIRTTKKGKKMILKNLPKEKIVAIYAGGSFVRREMNNKSDVDLWVILKDSRLLGKAKSLHSKLLGAKAPSVLGGKINKSFLHVSNKFRG
jgi:predicted nucleotidyltransferase